LRKSLMAGGYRVLTAADGREAIAVAGGHAGTIHVLITDLIMPRMGGAELAGELAARHPDLIVMYMSGYTDRCELKSLGPHVACSYVQKPFTPGTVMRKVRELLDAGATRGGCEPGIPPTVPSRRPRSNTRTVRIG
jgi:DNA-binding NtrC family response regulator